MGVNKGLPDSIQHQSYVPVYRFMSSIFSPQPTFSRNNIIEKASTECTGRHTYVLNTCARIQDMRYRVRKDPGSLLLTIHNEGSAK